MSTPQELEEYREVVEQEKTRARDAIAQLLSQLDAAIQERLLHLEIGRANNPRRLAAQVVTTALSCATSDFSARTNTIVSM